MALGVATRPKHNTKALTVKEVTDKLDSATFESSALWKTASENERTSHRREKILAKGTSDKGVLFRP